MRISIKSKTLLIFLPELSCICIDFKSKFNKLRKMSIRKSILGVDLTRIEVWA